MKAPTPLLSLRNVSKSFGGVQALAGVTLDVRQNEIVSFIGPNGAGKTTLMQAIAGTLAADAGQILWRGTPLPLSRRREFLFYLPDGVRPWEDQYVARVTELFAAIYGRSQAFLAQTIHALGLAPVLRQRVVELSKGYARRLLLALALLTPQPLLMMDEPFDGFDLRQTRDIMNVLREVAGAGRALVLAIHQLRDAARVCDRFVLLAEGRVRGVGTLAELQAQTGKAAADLEDVFLALT